MTQTNRLSKLVKATSKFPKGIRSTLWSKAFGRVVPMVGTANIKYHRAMQNHIGQLHAVAMALIAETATGFVTGMNVPDSSIVLIKSMHIDYKRPSKGDMTATATLSAEQILEMQTSEKGETLVPVTIMDESGKEPVECQMVWAWVSKDRLKNK
jgi:acyl-coenzyme A thioesterase PaaI-like protein